jgi:predicted CXXCH cytochrome family protein
VRRVAIAIVVLATISFGLFTARAIDDIQTPRELHGAPHATSGQCARCHPSHHESWRRTFHRTMTQEASDVSVLGAFDGASFEYGGVTARMTREDGAFVMHIGDTRADVVRTVGSRRVQQYLARDRDVLFRLPLAWNIEEARWMHMNGAFLTPDPAFPAAREDYHRHVVRWNDNCVFCHNVGANPGQREDGTFETEVAELGIACEACHGPGEQHVRANADPLRRYALHFTDVRDPTIVNPARLSPARSAEICGRCHGQRVTDDMTPFLRDGDPFVPGEPLSRYSDPLRSDTMLHGDDTVFRPRFWPDGTARLTAYEYQGLLQSPCTDLTCTSCHGMHEGDPRGQIRPSQRGDVMCTSCHEEMETPAAARAHTKHDDVRCADCHMPRIVYGLIDVHRSHRIELPAPADRSRPDACTLCHAERSPAWAIDEHARLWPGASSHHDAVGELPEMTRLALAGDPIERAVACAALGRDDALGDRDVRLGLLADVMIEDPYPAVRRIAWRSARALSRGDLDWNDYDPTGRRSERERFARLLGGTPPDRALAERLRAQAAHSAIEIGE